MEKKTARETLESMKPKPENDSPRRSWLYISMAIVIIFGLTFLFQQFNEPSTSEIDSNSFDQLKDRVNTLQMELDLLKEKKIELEERLKNLK